MAELKDDRPITLTHHGQPVAVLLSIGAYRQLVPAPLPPHPGFWEALQLFRQTYLNEEFNLDAELDLIESLRDRSPGRDFNFD